MQPKNFPFPFTTRKIHEKLPIFPSNHAIFGHIDAFHNKWMIFAVHYSFYFQKTLLCTVLFFWLELNQQNPGIFFKSIISIQLSSATQLRSHYLRRQLGTTSPPFTPWRQRTFCGEENLYMYTNVKASHGTWTFWVKEISQVW